jgi:hypothetical protein
MITAWLGTGPVLGAALYIDPNKAQSADQQSRDRYDCHLWAVQQTGIDPIRGGQCPQFPLAGLRGVIRNTATNGRTTRISCRQKTFRLYECVSGLL